MYRLHAKLSIGFHGKNNEVRGMIKQSEVLNQQQLMCIKSSLNSLNHIKKSENLHFNDILYTE